jgi:hypothetical protein
LAAPVTKAVISAACDAWVMHKTNPRLTTNRGFNAAALRFISEC